MKTRVVLGYPFSSAIFAFLDGQLYPGYGGYKRIGSPYYRTLYGRPSNTLRELGLSLLVLFDEVKMVAADTALPDSQKYNINGRYHNPEFGIEMDWKTWQEKSNETDEFLERDINDEVISSIMQRVPLHAQRQILRDIRVEMHLALEYQCAILCSPGREKIIKHLIQFELTPNQDTGLLERSKIDQIEEYFTVVGPLFGPQTIDSLYDIKSNKEVRSYAHSFADYMLGDNAPQSKEKFINLLNTSMGNESFMKHTSGLFSVLSRILSSIGLFLGPIPSLGGLTADFLRSGVERDLQDTKWYELGPEIRKASSLAKLKTFARRNKTSQE